MDSAIENWETEEDPEIIIKVKEAQVRLLYKQSWVPLMGVLVIGISLCIAFWHILPQWKLTLWMGILTLMTLTRAFLTFCFFQKSPTGSHVDKWAKWHVLGTSFSGCIWALPSIFLWPHNYPEYHLVWCLCILPQSASAVSTYYTWKPSYIAFISFSTIPIALRFFYEGGLLHLVLGFLTLFFIIILLQSAKLMHKTSLRTLIVGFRNRALSSFLSEEKAKQEKLTQQLQKAHDQLQTVSLTDELTGLWNRRYLNTTIHKYVAQALRSHPKTFPETTKSTHNDLMFLMMDLDHFKVINDTYGHTAGDKILQQVSQLLTKSCRKTDTAIRWGGEEFLIITQNIHPYNDTTLPERIRRVVELYEFDIGLESPLHITCSLGVATFPFLSSHPELLSWEKVVGLADTCLFAAKRSGRNAWISIFTTDLATSDDLKPDIIKHIPDLLETGKLELKTNLKDNHDVCWSK